MRVVLLLAGAAIGLAACGRDDQAQTNQSVEDSLTAESIVANDITAIDAVTADAANMAADVDINFTNDQVLYNGPGTVPEAAPPASGSSPSPAKSDAPRRRAQPPARPAPAADNATD